MLFQDLPVHKLEQPVHLLSPASLYNCAYTSATAFSRSSFDATRDILVGGRDRGGASVVGEVSVTSPAPGLWRSCHWASISSSELFSVSGIQKMAKVTEKTDHQSELRSALRRCLY